MHCSNLRLVLGLWLVRVSSTVRVRVRVKLRVSVLLRVSRYRDFSCPRPFVPKNE